MKVYSLGLAFCRIQREGLEEISVVREKKLVGNVVLEVLCSGRKRLSEIIALLQTFMLGDLHCCMLALCFFCGC